MLPWLFFVSLAFAQPNEIPWKVEIAKPELTYDQRFELEATVTIDGKELIKRSGDDLVTLMQIEDSQGRVYQEHSQQSLQAITPAVNQDMRRAELIAVHRAVVTPGDYTVTITLDDRTSGAHNSQRTVVHAALPKGDPLASSFEGMPAVEILATVNEPEAYFHPELAGRLHLPVENRTPVRVEVVLRLPSWSGRVYYFSRACLSLLVPQLKALSEITPRNGVINVTLLDTIHGEMIPVAGSGQPLTWNLLRPGIANPYSDLIDARHYKPAKHFDAEGLTQIFEQRLANPAARRAEERVFLVYLTVHTEYGKPPSWKPSAFDRTHVEKAYVIDDYPPLEMNSDRRPVGIAPGDTTPQPGRPIGPPFMIDRSEVVLIAPHAPRNAKPPWEMAVRGDFASVGDILHSLNPRVFTVRKPIQFRDALAAIIEDLSRM